MREAKEIQNTYQFKLINRMIKQKLPFITKIEINEPLLQQSRKIYLDLYYDSNLLKEFLSQKLNRKVEINSFAQDLLKKTNEIEPAFLFDVDMETLNDYIHKVIDNSIDSAVYNEVIPQHLKSDIRYGNSDSFTFYLTNSPL